MPDKIRRADGTEKGFQGRALGVKLRPPSMGPRYMPRPRLSDKVANSGSFRLALISAPAGSGKTTMLSEWYLDLQERQVSTAWLSLDAYDNEPRRFLVHLALRHPGGPFGYRQGGSHLSHCKSGHADRRRGGKPGP